MSDLTMGHISDDPVENAQALTGTVRANWVVTLPAGGAGSPKVVALYRVEGQRDVLGYEVAGRGVKLRMKDAIAISAVPDMLDALRKVPLFRMTDDALGWQCVGCGQVSGINPDGSDRDESCAPGCYVPIVEAAIAKAEGR